MAGALFKTNPYSLLELLQDCHKGELQLPDFQRSWVWDEDRIRSLIASASRAFPIGALMTLETGGEVDFKPRPVEGAPDAAAKTKPRSLLLDGQQRITSLYKVTFRDEPLEIQAAKNRKRKVWRLFYIDIAKALDPNVDREDAIIAVPDTRVVARDFGRDVLLDVTTREKEFQTLMYPASAIYKWDVWLKEFIGYSQRAGTFAEQWDIVSTFKDRVLDNFIHYQVPVIALDRATSKEAVCTVFEKVNTGGKPLDAFELVTAMYAADDHELRRDWYGKDGATGRHQRFVDAVRSVGSDRGILANVGSTDFLHAISLFHTRERRRIAEEAGKQGKELPQVTGARAALLNLPLDAYKKYEAQVERGFIDAAKFLHRLHIFHISDLPYQSQLVPLAAILADLGTDADHDEIRRRLTRWYWCGVFGELYGSAIETRFGRDFMEVPAWAKSQGPQPATIREATFRADRLETMRMKLSAAYKGVNALLMMKDVQDIRSGEKFDHVVFFGENVDIHHVFPKSWCQKKGISPKTYDSIINKTPLTYRTNRIIGGDAPSNYIARLENGGGGHMPIDAGRLDGFLRSHFIDPSLLRVDDFFGFMRDRQQRLLTLIEAAMEKSAYAGDRKSDDLEEEDDDEAEAQLTISSNR